MANKRVRCVLIGCGQHMTNNLLPFLHRLDRHEIIACIDPNEAQAKQLAGKIGARQSARDIRDISLADVEAAIVAVPPQPSSDITQYLIRNHIHCFVEKPAGHSTPALDALWREAQAHGTYVQLGFNFRYAEAVTQLYQASHTHRQAPHCLTIDFFSRHPSIPQWGSHHTVDAWFRQNGVHAVDLAQWLISSPIDHVQAHLVAQNEDKFLSMVLLHHHNGAISLLRAGNQTKNFIIRIDVHGEDGSRYNMPSLEQVYLDLDAGQPSGKQLFMHKNLDHGWSRSGFGPELEQFFNVVETGVLPELPAPSLLDAYKASELCDKVLGALNLYQPVDTALQERNVAS